MAAWGNGYRAQGEKKDTRRTAAPGREAGSRAPRETREDCEGNGVEGTERL